MMILNMSIMRKLENLLKSSYKGIMVQIKDYLDTNPEQIEQSDNLIEAYESAGGCYYIFDNNGQLRASWIIEHYECYISGPLTIEEMKLVIDSIQKG